MWSSWTEPRGRRPANDDDVLPELDFDFDPRRFGIDPDAPNLRPPVIGEDEYRDPEVDWCDDDEDEPAVEPHGWPDLDPFPEELDPLTDGHKERLRQRFLDHGFDFLEVDEQLELLLAPWDPRGDHTALARALADRFEALADALAAPRAELLAVEGMSEGLADYFALLARLAQRYLSLSSAGRIPLTSCGAVGRFITRYPHLFTDGHYFLLFADYQCDYIASFPLNRGRKWSGDSNIYFTLTLALSCHARYAIVVCNHRDTPALHRRDHWNLRLFMRALRTIDVEVLDFVYINGGNHQSFFSSGELNDIRREMAVPKRRGGSRE